jgi:Cft2 family RNA processing exonuclease
MTPATRDLLHWLLPDAGAIQENDVERLNRRNARRAEAEVTAIYTKADAIASLDLIDVRAYDRWFKPLPGVRARLRNAGHILGSAFIEMEIAAAPRPVRLVFSGDIGPLDKALQPDPTLPGPADIALIESTYGDTVRERLSEAERRALLGRELTQALKGGGNIIVPVFAVGAGDPGRYRAAQTLGRSRFGAGVLDCRWPCTTVFRGIGRSAPKAGHRWGATPASETVSRARRFPDSRRRGGRGSGMCDA